MSQKKIFDDQLIVVTGAAGFIGSCVVRHLNEKGFSNLLLVDDFKSSEKWKNVIGKKYVDFISRHELFKWLEGRARDVEAFIHLGACSDTVCKDGDYFLENNYRFSVKLAEYALNNDHRFIYASSGATYGDGSLGFSDDPDMIDELKPLNLYGFSKHMFDLWVKSHGALDQVVGLKYFNVYGPNEYHKERMASMVYHLTPKIQKEKVAQIFASSEPDKFADGEQCRDFIYVKDVAKVTCSFLDHDDINGIFNVGRGEVGTWNQLCRAIFSSLNIPENIQYVPMPKDLVKQYQNYTCADMSRYFTALEKKGAEKPKFYSVEEGVKEYVEDYLLTGERW